MTENVTLFHADCLDAMKEIADGSVDMIAADLPYGVTACKWDSVIPFAPLWEQFKRIIKPKGAIVLTASQPFTSALVMSNPGWFRYEWIWKKNRATGHLDAKKKPLKTHENICVFYESLPTYAPQMRKGEKHIRGPRAQRLRSCEVYSLFNDKQNRNYESDEFYPQSVLEIGAEMIPVHPTQKPVALFEYLIRTYTNEGETVLDCCFGSGTTGVAAIRTGRKFIGIEQDADYFCVGAKRISDAVGIGTLFEANETDVDAPETACGDLFTESE